MYSTYRTTQHNATILLMSFGGQRSPSGEHVLLEAVALCAHEGDQPLGPGDIPAPGDHDSHQPQRLLASGQDTGNTDRDDQRVAPKTGTAFDPRPMDESPRLRVTETIRKDRLLRIEEPPGADPHAGWCGGRGLNTPAYPISLQLVSAHGQMERIAPGFRRVPAPCRFQSRGQN